MRLKLIIRGEDDIDEMYDFVETDTGSGIFGARYGAHDDTVMANLITYYTGTQLRPRWAVDEEDAKEKFHCRKCLKIYAEGNVGDQCSTPECEGFLEEIPKADFQNSDYSPIYDKEGQDNDPSAGYQPSFAEL